MAEQPCPQTIAITEEILSPFVKPGDTAVDIGCGGGFFSAGLAELVGTTGKVISVDLQPEMLEYTRAYAEKRGVIDRITLHQCTSDSLKLEGTRANFVLAFYVVHEIPDHESLFKQVRDVLLPDGKFLIVEPNGHVKPNEFAAMIEVAQKAGFKPVETVKVLFSRGVVLG